jgi:CRISPR/Cas system-associated endonuclease Cas1
MHEGNGSLVKDLIEPYKAEMIDMIVFKYAKEVLERSDYEPTQHRCMLSDELTKKMIGLFHDSIKNEKIDELIQNFYEAIMNNCEFRVRY